MDENREWSLKELMSNEPKRVIEALLSLSFYDNDWEFVEKICIEYSSNDDDYVRGVAVLCFGHLARIHGHLNIEKVKPIIMKADNDKSEFVRGNADSSKDDIYVFLNIKI